MIESVQALQQVVSAEPRRAPVIMQELVSGGKYRWIVKVPLKLTYWSSMESHVDNIDVALVIDRDSWLENPSGVVIERWIPTSP